MPPSKILKANPNSAASWRLCTLLPAALAVLGAVLVLLQNHPYGPGLHWDSVNYISVARSLLAGEGFVEFLGFPYNAWPPLYPILLAAPGLLFGLDPHVAAGPLNALLFGLTVFVAARWLLERVTSHWLALWGGLAAVFSIPLTFVSSWAMSGTAFIFFVTLALFCMDRYLRDNRRAALVWTGLFTALACLTKYSGGILLIALLFGLLLQPGARLLEKMKRGVIFALLSAVPISLWLLRTTLAVGQPFGAKQDDPLPDESIIRYVNVVLTELVEWILPKMPSAYVPLDEARRLAAALTAAALLMLAAVIGFALIRLRRRPALWRSWRLLFLCGGFALIYFVSTGIISKFVWVELETGNRRYWSPMYLPLLFALVFALDRLLMWLRSTRPPAVRAFASGALAILLLIWLGSTIEVSRQTVARARGDGQDEVTHLIKGYAAPAWVNNDVIQFMQKTQTKHSAIYSNKPAGLYIHTDPDGLSRILPQESGGPEWTINWALKRYPYDTYLVWFNDSIPVPPQSASYGLTELDAIPALERIATLQSGVVFRINRQQASEA